MFREKRTYEVKAYPYRHQDIERIAGSLRNKICEILKNDKENYGNNEINTRILLKELLRKTGGKIDIAEDLSHKESEGGSFRIYGDKKYEIWLSPYTFSSCDNWWIAHNIGHYVLHYHLQNPKPELPIYLPAYGSTQADMQANRFAAGLIMPKDVFLKKYEEYEGNIDLLAGYFNLRESFIQGRKECIDKEDANIKKEEYTGGLCSLAFTKIKNVVL